MLDQIPIVNGTKTKIPKEIAAIIFHRLIEFAAVSLHKIEKFLIDDAYFVSSLNRLREGPYVLIANFFFDVS